MTEVRVALGLLLLLALTFVWQAREVTLALHIPVENRLTPTVADFDKEHYRDLLDLLPAHGNVGYVDGLSPESALSQSLFQLTQYVLAPRTIVRGAGPTWVIGNFAAHPEGQEAWKKAEGLELVRRSKTGACLFRSGRRDK